MMVAPRPGRDGEGHEPLGRSSSTTCQQTIRSSEACQHCRGRWAEQYTRLSLTGTGSVMTGPAVGAGV